MLVKKSYPPAFKGEKLTTSITGPCVTAPTSVLQLAGDDSTSTLNLEKKKKKKRKEERNGSWNALLMTRVCMCASSLAPW
jgi:hypothetical protein